MGSSGNGAAARERAIRVSDMTGEREIASEVELEEVLLRRNASGVNHFHLFPAASKHPLLIMMVNGELAWLYFLSDSDHVGCYARGTVPGLDPKGRTRFVYVGPQDEERFNDQVVQFADAFRAAKEFFATRQLPRCLDWREPS